jgi:BirA family transcriptional regulator, biotin operon repressor / biotin---[acetyl-CoA-carboxylase] ligase
MIVVRYKRVDSTNDKAKVLAARGAREWTTVVAEVQTRGRGRSGKKWESRKGGLWFSVILRPEISPLRVTVLQLLASNSIRKALREEIGLKSGTKWPNDIISGEKKIAGILVESRSQGGEVSFVVVGIGLNVNQRQSSLPAGATSVYAISHETYSVEKIMSKIVENMRHDYASLGTPDEILAEWWTDCVHRSKKVKIQTRNGTIEGISKGIDTDGSLLLAHNGQLENVTEGTLRILNGETSDPDGKSLHANPKIES